MSGDRDEPIAAELLEAQAEAVEVSCPMCLGRGRVFPAAGGFVVRIEHGRLCPRRPRRP